MSESVSTGFTNARSGYVLDTSAIINLERLNRLKDIDPPGDWMIVPAAVARELNPSDQRTPETTKKWLQTGKVAKFTKEEESLYRRLIINPSVDDGEAQAIAIASCRKKILVIDEKKSGQVWKIAEMCGVTCINSEEFMNKISPRLPGL